MLRDNPETADFWVVWAAERIINAWCLAHDARRSDDDEETTNLKMQKTHWRVTFSAAQV